MLPNFTRREGEGRTKTLSTRKIKAAPLPNFTSSMAKGKKQRSRKQPQRKQINKNNNTHTTADDENVCTRKKRGLKTIRIKN